jgi:hypothetical protein
MTRRWPALSLVAALAVVASAGCATRVSNVDPAPSGTTLADRLPAPPSQVPDHWLSVTEAPTTASPTLAGGSDQTGAPPAPGGSQPKITKAPESGTETHVPSAAELRRALLGAGDLPGFGVEGGDPGSAGGEGGCPVLDTDFSAGATGRAEVVLYRASPATYVRERMRQLSPSVAQNALARVRGAPSSCGRYTTTVADLGPVEVTVSALGVGRIGDGSVAVRITMKPKSVALTVVQNLVLVRRGGTLIILTVLAPSIDDALTSAAAAKAYAKTKRVW